MLNTLTVEVPQAVKITVLVIYILGFLFCIFIKGVIDKTPLAKSSNKNQLTVLFMIWLASPALLVGLLIVTIKTLFKNGNK